MSRPGNTSMVFMRAAASAVLLASAIYVARAAAIPRVSDAPAIDGKLSDPAWQAAAEFAPFVEYKTGTPAEHPTSARMCYNDRALYVAFECAEPNTAALKAVAETETQVNRDDCVEFFVVPGHGRSYYHFLVNSKNRRYDQRNWGHPARQDNAWDGVWRSAVSIQQDTQWTVEIAIPWFNLAADLDKGPWSVQFCRQRRAGTPEFSAAFFPKGNFHNRSQFEPIERPDVDFSPFVGFELFDVRVPNYQVTEAGYAYVLTGVAESITPKKVRMTVTDRPESGRGATESLDLTLQAHTPVPFSARMPMHRLGDRKVAVTLSDPETEATLYVNAFDAHIFPEMLTAVLDRNMYDVETEAMAVFRMNVPRLLDPLVAEAVVSLPPGKPLEVREPVTTPARTVVRLPLKNIPPGKHPTTLRVVDAEGNRVTELTTSLRKTEPAPEGITVTKVDRDRKVMLLNGKPFFPLGIIGVPREQLAAVGNAGFNTVMSWGMQAERRNLNPDGTPEQQRAKIVPYLDEAWSHGLYFIENPTQFNPQRVRRVPRDERPQIYKTFAEDVMPVLCKYTAVHPAVIGYQNIDEPPPDEFGLTCCKFIADALLEHDPYHVRFTLFCSAHIPDWQDVVWDIPQRDIYPRENTPMIHVHRQVGIGVADADRMSVPFIHIPLLDLSSARHTGITGPQQIVQGYLSIIAGSRGIIWWIWPPRHKANWEAMQQLASELPALSPVILAQTPRQTVRYTDYSTEDTVKVLVKNHKDRTYIIAANAVPRDVDVRMGLPDSFSGRADVAFEDRTVPVRDGIIEDTFAGHGRHVYALDGTWPDGGDLVLTVALRPPPAGSSDTGPRASSVANLVLDPGFESDSAWVFPHEREVEAGMVTETQNSGKRAGMITRRPETGVTRVTGWQARLQPMTRYLFGGHMKAIGGNVRLYLRALNDTPATRYLRQVTALTPVDRGAGWDRYEITFTTQEDPLVVVPVCEVGGKGMAWFDDVFLYPAEAETVNYVPNSGFEKDDDGLPCWPEGWNPMYSFPQPGFIGTPDSPWGTDDTVAWEGRQSLRMRKKPEEKSLRPLLFKVLKNIPEGPAVYSLYMKADKPDTTVTILFRTPEYNPIKVKVPAEWKRFVFPVTLGATGRYGRRYSYVYLEDPATLWIDAVQVERGTAVSPYVAGPEYVPVGR